jgi:DNA-binding CsgD family transcriptional regulator
VTFSFEILPPWHRSWLAYAAYFLLIFGFISFTLIFSSRSTRRKQEALQLVKEEEFRRKEEELTQEALIAEQKIINLKNEKLEVEVEKEKALIERKNSEMANFALQVTQKNEILSDVKKRLLVESIKVNPQSKIEIEKIIQTIDKDMEPGIDWDQFELHFDQVHGDFIKRLKNKYPQLTPNDLRMCAYLRMNISTKEIAPLMRISVRGVEISRYRLRKKLNLDRSVSLTDYILNV